MQYRVDYTICPDCGRKYTVHRKLVDIAECDVCHVRLEQDDKTIEKLRDKL